MRLRLVVSVSLVCLSAWGCGSSRPIGGDSGSGSDRQVGADAQGCGMVTCRLFCPNGYQRDPSTGCELCACIPDDCPALGCDPNCGPSGVKTDPNGCPTCQCIEPGCSALDEQGCRARRDCSPRYLEACDCACSEGQGGSCTPQSFGQCCDFQGCDQAPTCDGPLCDIFCAYGNKVDANGCELCACNPPPPDSCVPQGGQCLSSPSDPGFPARCEEDFQQETLDASCPAPNQACCKTDCRTQGCSPGAKCDACLAADGVVFVCIPEGAAC
jgi:hypothetical protein